MDEGPEIRRKRRLALPPLGFLGVILLLATVVALVVLVIYLVGGPEEAGAALAG